MLRVAPLVRVCAALILASGQAAADERPSLYEFELAYPKEIRFVEDAPKPPYLALETIVTVILDLDKKGRLSGVGLRSMSDPLFAEWAESYFQNLEFEPARFQGKKIQSRLPVSVQFRPRSSQPDLVFPVDDKLRVADRYLYEQGYRDNSIFPPGIGTFPSYYCDFKWQDSLSRVPVVLLKVELDKEGNPTAIEEVFSTNPSLAIPIQSAVLWSEFAAAKVGVDSTASSSYLLVTFPPRADYPTEPFVWHEAQKEVLAERIRVAMLADTVGLMLTPIPKKRDGETVVSYGILKHFQGTISAAVSIDTAGRMTALRKYGASQKYSREVNGLLSELEMFPALDFQGNPRPYEGLIHIMGTGSTNIRIRYFWHPLRVLAPSF